MKFNEAIALAERGLTADLPGVVAQAHLAPIPRRQWPAGFNPGKIRNAAGLLLVFPVDDHAHLVLTQRAHTLERHGAPKVIVAVASSTGDRKSTRLNSSHRT